jgi:hypothetical protein
MPVAVATMMNVGGAVARATSPSRGIVMNIGSATTWSASPTRGVVMDIASAGATSPARRIVVDPFLTMFGLSICYLSLSGIFLGVPLGFLLALHLEKFNSTGAVILLEGSTQVICTGLTANT